jgi:hypothetical protein
MARGKRSGSSTSFRLNPTGSGSDALRNGAASGDGFGPAGRGALTVTHARSADHRPQRSRVIVGQALRTVRHGLAVDDERAGQLAERRYHGAELG